MRADNRETAALLCLPASDTNPTDYLSPGLLGQAYLDMGSREAGEQALQKAMRNLDRHMKMNPDDSWALVVGAVNLAELGDREQAIAWAERAIDASDDEPVICYNSACTFAVLGEYNRTLDMLERALALSGSSATRSSKKPTCAPRTAKPPL